MIIKITYVFLTRNFDIKKKFMFVDMSCQSGQRIAILYGNFTTERYRLLTDFGLVFTQFITN